MATDDKPTATVLRIKVRHADVDVFVERFASQVTRSGVFIPTRAPKPIGTEIRFEIRTADDRPVLVGQGKVRLTRPHDPAHPRVVAGMAVELQRVGRDSRDVLLRMLEIRKRRGLVDGPEGMPLPGDPEHEERDEVTVARAPRPRPTSAQPEPARPRAASVAPPVVAVVEPSPPVARAPAPPPEAEVAAPPIAPSPPVASAPALTPLVARVRAVLDLSTIPAPPPAPDLDLDDWPEASQPLDEVLVRARALLELGGADLDLEALAAPVAIDAAEISAAAEVALGRPLRSGRSAVAESPLPAPAAPPPVETPSAPPPVETPSAPPDVDAVAAAEPSHDPIVDGAAEAPTADRARGEPAPVAASPTPDAEAAARARAARAQRERARREANDRALRERQERIQRELAAREQAERARAARPAADPLADLDLDSDAETFDREVTRRVPMPTGRRPAVRVPERGAAPERDTTRRVDAATLAAEALDAADLRSSLAAGATPADLEFLERLSLEAAAPPRTAATVRRIPPRTSPPRPAPGPPPPTEPAIDDDSIDISIDFDD